MTVAKIGRCGLVAPILFAQILAVRILATLVAAFCIGISVASAEGAASYPQRPVRIIVPFPAGGAVDLVMRAFAQRMSAAWQQPVVVENIVGASGSLAAAQAARAPKDGYTLIAGVGTTTSMLKVLKPKLGFDPINDFAAISLLATFPSVLVVRRDLPAGNVQGLIDLAKAQPAKLTFASSGFGSSLHLAGEMFKLVAGVDIMHVPFSGSAPAVNALLGGHVDMSFDTMPSIWSQVQGGKLRALGVASTVRTPAAPELPPIGDTLPGFDVTAWQGLLAPAGTPDAIVGHIAHEVRGIAANPVFAKAMLDVGAVVTATTPAETEAFIRADYVKWQRVMRESGLTPE
jgi:tripartite-type tricarboxylate transporter receptor subunit TctC